VPAPTPGTASPDAADPEKSAPESAASAADSGGQSPATTGGPGPSDAGKGPTVSVREESALAWRDQLLEPIETDLVRHLTRVLRDEQNEVLDRLRSERHPTADSILPSVGEQVERYQSAALPLLRQAADRGSKFVVSPGEGGESGPDAAPPNGGWDAVRWAADLAVDVVVPLRDRLEEAISDAIADSSGSDARAYDVSGVSERVGASYRQWKSTQLAQAARHHASVAFAEGAFAATPEGTERCWVVDDDGGPCPDCDDNTLAGPVPKGQPFPTGQTHPPAHKGCRCIVVAPPS
ncbi:MAG TPA: hypothetical protein VFQ48_05685, partial [Pseudonocardiaceae bacterium]|nr:hypothetical protein [Pseudonocardiaceae bacterium]